MRGGLEGAIARHAQHDIRECDCSPAVVLLVLHLRDVAEWIADTLADPKVRAALTAAVNADTEGDDL